MSTSEIAMTPWDRDVAPRLAPAYDVAAGILRDGAWHSHKKLVPPMLEASDILRGSATQLLRDLAHAKYLERRRGPKQTSYYRVAQKGLDERPELRLR